MRVYEKFRYLLIDSAYRLLHWIGSHTAGAYYKPDERLCPKSCPCRDGDRPRSGTGADIYESLESCTHGFFEPNCPLCQRGMR